MPSLCGVMRHLILGFATKGKLSASPQKNFTSPRGCGGGQYCYVMTWMRQQGYEHISRPETRYFQAVSPYFVPITSRQTADRQLLSWSSCRLESIHPLKAVSRLTSRPTWRRDGIAGELCYLCWSSGTRIASAQLEALWLAVDTVHRLRTIIVSRQKGRWVALVVRGTSCGEDRQDKPPTAVARHQAVFDACTRTRQRPVKDNCVNTVEVYKNLKDSRRGWLLLSVSSLHCFQAGPDRVELLTMTPHRSFDHSQWIPLQNLQICTQF